MSASSLSVGKGSGFEKMPEAGARRRSGAVMFRPLNAGARRQVSEKGEGTGRSLSDVLVRR